MRTTKTKKYFLNFHLSEKEMFKKDGMSFTEYFQDIWVGDEYDTEFPGIILRNESFLSFCKNETFTDEEEEELKKLIIQHLKDFKEEE